MKKNNEIRKMYEEAKLKSLSVPCEIIKSIVYEIEEGDELVTQKLEIVKGNSKTRGCMGVHLMNPSEAELDRWVDRCMNDVTDRIYIYK